MWALDGEDVAVDGVAIDVLAGRLLHDWFVRDLNFMTKQFPAQDDSTDLAVERAVSIELLAQLSQGVVDRILGSNVTPSRASLVAGNVGEGVGNEQEHQSHDGRKGGPHGVGNCVVWFTV